MRGRDCLHHDNAEDADKPELDTLRQSPAAHEPVINHLIAGNRQSDVKSQSYHGSPAK
jgi:hypothetical protein